MPGSALQILSSLKGFFLAEFFIETTKIAHSPELSHVVLNDLVRNREVSRRRLFINDLINILGTIIGKSAPEQAESLMQLIDSAVWGEKLKIKFRMKPVRISDHRSIVFFTGAGMSAESGVPTYRGSGGIWHQYRWEEFACQEAFDENPEKVLEFHELRRKSVLQCRPHPGHFLLARIEREHPHVTIVTQNIDGMHQRAGSRNVIELHGSLWRMRCAAHGIFEDLGEIFKTMKCPYCGAWLRPDIVWFGDYLSLDVMDDAASVIQNCDLFISIGTSGVVYPAAAFPKIAKDRGARCIEINPEPNDASCLYPETIRESASKGLKRLFENPSCMD